MHANAFMNNPPPVRGTAEDQAQSLQGALHVVKVQGYQMRKAIDDGNLLDTLRHAACFLAELRTSLLSPKNYYQLYLAVFDQLGHLSIYLKERRSENPPFEDLYELVQHAGNIVPRLYLMITVGGCYLELETAPHQRILVDMLEMCRGVQHPVRGLFLRHYLIGTVKDSLVTGINDDIGKTMSMAEPINFIIDNFGEMNKLWVRLQYQGHSREREKRELERKELKILVGTNLVRLSQLEVVDLNLYQKSILAPILEQIISCRDVIAQEYLMDVIIQVFPDTLHLKTLHQILEATSDLHPDTDIKGIVVALIDRLESYFARENGGSPKEADIGDINLFEIFWKEIRNLVNRRVDMPLVDVLSLLSSLMGLCLRCCSEELEYINQVFNIAAEKLASSGEKRVDITNPNSGKSIVKLLTTPLDSFKNPLVLLQLDNFVRLASYLSYRTRKAVSLSIAESLIKSETKISDESQANALLKVLEPLLIDQEDQPQLSFSKTNFRGGDNIIDMEDFVDEQNVIARVIHLFDCDSDTQLIDMMMNVYKNFEMGGIRCRFTYPALIFKALDLIRRIKKSCAEGWDRECKKLFRFIHQMISSLPKKGQDLLEKQALSSNAYHYTSLASAFSLDYIYELSFKLYLQACGVCEMCNFEDLAYDFIAQALGIYENDISDSKTQILAINLLIGTLCQSHCFSPENYDTLVTKCALYASKLLQKSEQARSIYLCANLFWCSESSPIYKERLVYNDEKRVLECLQKSLKVADSLLNLNDSVQLLVEILNRYLYFYEAQCPTVTEPFIDSLVDLIKINLDNYSTDVPDDINILEVFRTTVERFEEMKRMGDVTRKSKDMSMSPKNIDQVDPGYIESLPSKQDEDIDFNIDPYRDTSFQSPELELENGFADATLPDS